jgi:hypothetical protein
MFVPYFLQCQKCTLPHYLWSLVVLISLSSAKTKDMKLQIIHPSHMTYWNGLRLFQLQPGITAPSFNAVIYWHLSESNTIPQVSMHHFKIFHLNIIYLSRLIKIYCWNVFIKLVHFSSPGYGKPAACEIVKNFHVVNDSADTAERGVKLGFDYLSSTSSETKYQHILQVVENNRAQVPNQHKRRKVSEQWFLHL